MGRISDTDESVRYENGKTTTKLEVHFRIQANLGNQGKQTRKYNEKKKQNN